MTELELRHSQIDEALEMVERFWHQYPALRLGEMVVGLVSSLGGALSDLEQLPDSDLLRAMEDALEGTPSARPVEGGA